jgi:hypothetical protein
MPGPSLRRQSNRPSRRRWHGVCCMWFRVLVSLTLTMPTSHPQLPSADACGCGDAIQLSTSSVSCISSPARLNFSLVFSCQQRSHLPRRRQANDDRLTIPYGRPHSLSLVTMNKRPRRLESVRLNREHTLSWRRTSRSWVRTSWDVENQTLASNSVPFWKGIVAAWGSYVELFMHNQLFLHDRPFFLVSAWDCFSRAVMTCITNSTNWLTVG